MAGLFNSEKDQVKILINVIMKYVFPAKVRVMRPPKPTQKQRQSHPAQIAFGQIIVMKITKW